MRGWQWCQSGCQRKGAPMTPSALRRRDRQRTREVKRNEVSLGYDTVTWEKYLPLTLSTYFCICPSWAQQEKLRKHKAISQSVPHNDPKTALNEPVTDWVLLLWVWPGDLSGFLGSCKWVCVWRDIHFSCCTSPVVSHKREVLNGDCWLSDRLCGCQWHDYSCHDLFVAISTAEVSMFDCPGKSSQHYLRWTACLLTLITNNQELELNIVEYS